MLTPPDADRVITAFRAFVPDERFREFLRVLNRGARAKKRLLAWQSLLWSRFVAAHPDVPVRFEDIASALCVCPVHLSRMSMESVPVESGYWAFPQDVLQTREELFPFANYVVHGPDWDRSVSTCLAPVCQECRLALNRWNAGRKHPFGMPRARTTERYQGDYFMVEDVFDVARGTALAGRAADPGDPWPSVGELVELRPPTGQPGIVAVLDIDRGVMRSCFSDGSAQRAILIARESATGLAVRGTRVCTVTRPPSE